MKRENKKYYSVLLGGILWAFLELIVYLNIYSFEESFVSLITYFSIHLAFGAILFFVIKATKYSDFIFLLYSVASLCLLRFISLGIKIILDYDNQFVAYLIPVFIRGTIYEGIVMFLAGILSGAIMIIINKSLLNKALNIEATENEKEDSSIK